MWTTVDTALIEVEFDEEFWEQYLLQTLVSFYRTHVAPRHDMAHIIIIIIIIGWRVLGRT